MYTQTEIKAAFDDEAGDAAGLTDVNEVTRWFNDAQALLPFGKDATDAITWTAGGATVTSFPTDLVRIERFVADESGDPDLPPGFIHGADYYSASASGFPTDGGGSLFYVGRWPDVTGVVASGLTRGGDAACVSYTLSRFYKKLSANRALYQRYSTLVGQNAVTMGDLADLSDSYLAEYEALRRDAQPLTSTAFYDE